MITPRQQMVEHFKRGESAQARRLADQLLSHAEAAGMLRPLRVKPPEDSSHIGDNLAGIIERETGDQIDCSECQSEIGRLNRLKPAQVLAEIDVVSAKIVARAKVKARKWHQRIAATLLPGLVQDRVKEWIREACGFRFAPPRNVSNESLQFVWPYWHGGASGDELRWSIRSVETFFDGTPQIVVVGDRPPWFTGLVISSPRKVGKSRTFRNSLKDMLTKMNVIATSEQIAERFVWMMDDCYFVRPFTVLDISVPRAIAARTKRQKGEWRTIKVQTMEHLTKTGRTNHDYATHSPHMAEKAKLQKILAEIDVKESPMLWEILYGNTFHGTPESPYPFLQLLNRKMSSGNIRTLCSKATVVNNLAGAWCPGLTKYLAGLLPYASRTESQIP